MTISEMEATAGTVREVMGRALKELVDDGALTREQGDIEILDWSMLQAVADE